MVWNRDNTGISDLLYILLPQTIFGDSAMSVVGGKKQLLFLLKTLTRFVPYDPPFALKVCAHSFMKWFTR